MNCDHFNGISWKTTKMYIRLVAFTWQGVIIIIVISIIVLILIFI